MPETQGYILSRRSNFRFPSAPARRWFGKIGSFSVELIDISSKKGRAALFVPSGSGWELVAAAFPQAELNERAKLKAYRSTDIRLPLQRNAPPAVFVPSNVGVMSLTGHVKRITGGWESVKSGGAVWLTDMVSGVLMRAHERQPAIKTLVPQDFLESDLWRGSDPAVKSFLPKAFSDWIIQLQGSVTSDETVETQWPTTSLGQVLTKFVGAQLEVINLPDTTLGS